MISRKSFAGGAAGLLALAACSQAGQQVGEAAQNAGQAATGALVAAVVPSGEYDLDPTHATLLWTVSHMGVSNYVQRFTSYKATLTLDAQKLENSKLAMEIDAASIKADYPADFSAKKLPWKSWDDQLAHDPKYMDANKYPKITFTSTKVERVGATGAKVTGDLNFRGVTKPVTLDVSLVGQTAKHMMTRAGALGFHAEGKIAGPDFGLQSPVAKSIKISFDGEFLQKQAGAEGAAPAAN